MGFSRWVGKISNIGLASCMPQPVMGVQKIFIFGYKIRVINARPA